MKHQTSILYIDDDQENLTGFEASFSRLFKIYTALDTSLACKILTKHNIQIVLVDYKMPKENGIEFVDRIRSKFPDTIFIIVSAYADMEIVIHALNMNCFYGFVQKPWDFHELNTLLKNAAQLFWVEQKNRQLTHELKTKNELLKKALINEQNANKTKNIFLQNISHEIRTPLNAIIGFSNMIQLSSPSTKIEYFASLINKSGMDLLQTFQNILDISIILSNQITKYKSLFSLKDLIINALETTPNHNPNVKIINKITRNTNIFTDRLKLMQVVQILLNNAFKFTSSGSVELNLIKQQKNYITLKISDTGKGIAADKLSKIFEPFQQGEETLSREYGGIGSGLFIAKTYVELMGGKIWAESNETGSSFYFTIKIST